MASRSERTDRLDQPAVPMDERLTAFLADAIDASRISREADAQRRGPRRHGDGRRMPAAMLFLRSPGGISHHPDEAVREEDVDAALQVGRKFLERSGSPASPVR